MCAVDESFVVTGGCIARWNSPNRCRLVDFRQCVGSTPLPIRRWSCETEGVAGLAGSLRGAGVAWVLDAAANDCTLAAAQAALEAKWKSSHGRLQRRSSCRIEGLAGLRTCSLLTSTEYAAGGRWLGRLGETRSAMVFASQPCAAR